MALVPGVKVGAYEITGLLGAGGMGEVYRARDARLGRDVAIKVLPAAFAGDSERLGRFEFEARAAAALSHLNITAVYDIGQHDSTPYIVTEFLDGETLRERLADGALPVRKAIEYSVQVANGLAAAHDKGIVHRDLKPENIFVTAADRVKILDFGLAKLTQAEGAFAGASALPTTPPNTTPGIVLGTVGYMSPEQVRGLPADHRSDIFALGAILHEMLSGRRAFSGATAMDAMTAILKEDPPALPIGERHIPPALERIVRRCLEKTPAARFKSADDLAFALEGLSSQSDATSLVTHRARPARREQLAWGAAALFLIATVALGALAYIRTTSGSAAPEIRLQIVTPAVPDLRLASFALSPDGNRLVFFGGNQLWLRSLGSETAQPLSGTEATLGISPFWSPDSQSIAFFTNDQLKRIDLATGLVRVLAKSTQAGSGTWNDQGTILFTPSPSSPLMRIGAGGGDLAEATHLDPPRQIAHRFPEFLPDGRHFLFLVSGPLETRGVYLGSLDSPETHRLFEADSPAKIMPPDAVLFMRDGALLAQRLNLETLRMEGEPVPVATRVMLSPGNFNAVAVSTSAAGSLAYRANAEERQFSWVDRSGRQIALQGGPDGAQPMASGGGSLSPDGGTLALGRTVNGNTDIWLIDLERNVQRRFTFEPVRERTPIWSPDGGRLAFASERTGVFDLYERAITGPATERLLVASPEAKVVDDWSQDGRFVLYHVQHPRTDRDLWVLPVTDDQKPFSIAQTEFAEADGRFSPDGRWIAYSSNETGQDEIYVQPFPGPGSRFQISTGAVFVLGGVQWRRDGRELFYLGSNNRVMAVPIAFSGSTVKAATPVALFTTASPWFRASADGQRFLVPNVTADAAPITVVLNWAGLQR